MKPHIVYVNECPNCGWHVDDNRLEKGLVCRRCLPDYEEPASPRELLEILAQKGRLDRLEKYRVMEELLESFESFFKECVGSPPWSAQRTWARRVFLGKSFSIIAPTGVGKTVFGIIIALFLASRGYRSLIVLPTTPLVLQVWDKARTFMERTGLNATVVAIHSRMKARERREVQEALEEGRVSVLITTSRYLINNAQRLAQMRFRFVFVDDVDAVLKSGKSITALLTALGFTEKDMEYAQKAIVLRRRIAQASEIPRGSEERRKRLQELSQELASTTRWLEERRRELGVSLIVSSATGRPRGPKVLLFRELLGFQAGSRGEQLRRIVDSYYHPQYEPMEEVVYRLVRLLGDGGLVFVPVDKGVEYAERLASFLREKGVSAEAFHSKNPLALNRFVEGETGILVGVAVYYGVMVRGLDYPWRIRYAVFTGVPRFRFSARFEDPHPTNVFRMLSILVNNAPKDVAEKARAYYVNVRRIMRRLSPAALQVIAQRLREGVEPGSDVERVFSESVKFIREALSEKRVLDALKLSQEIVLREEEGGLYIYIPDLMTYIQASGRTSRLFAGGLTRGLSVVIVDDPRLLEGLVSRMKWLVEDSEWVDFRELGSTGKLAEVLEEINRDREMVLRVIRGEITGEVGDLVKTILLVVESPNKARTIASFFGKPSVRMLDENLRAYEVATGRLILTITASGGHVKDLVIQEPNDARPMYPYTEFAHGVGVYRANGSSWFTPFYTSIKRCLACGYQTVDEIRECPRCGSTLIHDARRTVEVIRDLAMEVDTVLVGTDPDTEGEKIGWDLAVLLRPYTRNVRRIEFHEVTRRAITRALEETRDLQRPLVDAQLVRRIEDRWIGFYLSPILWRDFWFRYCPEHYGEESDNCRRENRNLSAGRVQTPVLKWIIDRYEEYKRSRTSLYRITLKGPEEAMVEVYGDETGIPPREARKLEGQRARVSLVESSEEDLSPPPPFTTDSMLSEASRHLGLGAPQVMRLAQDLFELGLITYHRTDSTRVSETGIQVAREYLRTLMGEAYGEYFVPRRWGEGGAHEAIRPTRPIDAEMLERLIGEGELELARPITRLHYRLYDLIFRRFIASQMRKARLVRHRIRIYLPRGKPVERDWYVGVRDEGFLIMYRSVELKRPLKPGEYEIAGIEKRTVYMTQLYTQGDVIREMKQRGIGRPSTYATIMEKLLTRRYVIESRRARKLVPTKLGREVYSFLDENFRSLISEDRTRQLEEKMDRVSEGGEDYIGILGEVYKEILGSLNEYRAKLGRSTVKA